MIASLHQYLLVNVSSIPRWFEFAAESLNSRTIQDGPFGILELGPMRPVLGNKHAALREVRVTAAWALEPGALDALAAACEEIRVKLHGATLQRATGERYTLEWAQITDPFPDSKLKALVQTVILSVPLRV